MYQMTTDLLDVNVIYSIGLFIQDMIGFCIHLNKVILYTLELTKK